MLEYHDLYGTMSEDLAKVANTVSERTGLKLKEDDDFDYGGQFFAHENEATIIVYRNWNSLEETWISYKWREYPIIIDISDTPRFRDFEQALTSSEDERIELLSRIEFDPNVDDVRVVFSLKIQGDEPSSDEN